MKEMPELAQAKRDLMKQLIYELVAISSVNPAMEGPGEYALVMWLADILQRHNIPYETYEVADERVAEGRRLSLIVRCPGREDTDKTLWFFAHTDTVSAGDRDAWHSDPFAAVEQDGKIYGLGAEDNGQGIVSLLATCLIMKENNIQAKCNIGFIFAADEETGSHYGLKPLAESGFFGSRDEAVVPDGGSADGSFIEIAEKSTCCLKFTVYGKQAHASMPQLGINAFSVGMRFAVEVEDTLKATYTQQDALFEPAYSTFEFTQKFANVESYNILPGKDSFLMDMRVLPGIDLGEILALIRGIADKYEQQYKVRIDIEVQDSSIAPPATPPTAEVVIKLTEALQEAGVQNIYCGGIGGGTCAEFLRRAGLPAVVWSTVMELAHQPNEYTILDNLVGDTAVFLRVIEKYS